MNRPPRVHAGFVVGVVALALQSPVHGRVAQAPSQSQAAPGQKISREWKRLEAPSLVLMGNARADELRRTAQEIERFRLAMRGLLPALRTEPPAPTVAIVFRDDGALTPFKPRDHGKPMDTVGAYFAPHADVNYIVMAMGRREYTYQVIFHEYTHLLVNQNIRRLPLWLSEGIADFFGTFDGSEHDGRLIIGRPMPEYVRMLAGVGVLMPLKKFIDPQSLRDLFKDGGTTARYYAQSWALTHYLFLGDNGAHRPQLGAFMAGVQGGGAPDVVFRRVFGDNLDPLDMSLRKYVNLMQLPAIQVTPPEVHLPADATPMTEADAEWLQADLLERTGAYDESSAHLNKAMSLDPANVAAKLTRARSLIDQDQAKDAIDILGAPDLAAIDDFPTTFLRAVANQATGQYEAAEAAYRRTVALRPDAAYAYYGLSMAQLALNRPEASATFSRVFLLQPGPGWYYSRMLDSQRLGIDRFVIADATSFVEQAGWQDTTSAYVTYIAALTCMRQQQPERAAQYLQDITAHVAAASWQASVAAFLAGKFSADALLGKANSPGLQTEAHAYIGIKANIVGDRAAAMQHLQWVRDKGQRSYTEYRLALGELDRMASNN